jgi:hypothetical protein
MYQKSILGEILVITFFAMDIAVATFAGESVLSLEIPNEKK